MLTSDTPVDLHAPGDGLLLNIVFFSLGALGLGYAIWRSVRERDPAPVLLVLGAMLAVLAEATFDLLGKIWYPANIRPRAFTMLDRPIPLFLVAGYIPWVGVLPLLLADWMRRGMRRRWLWALAIGIAVSNVIVDAIGTSAHTWSYYADGPLHYLTTAPILAALPPLAAWLILTIRPRLRGWQLVALVAIPPFTLSAVFAGTGWPMYAAMNIAGVPAAVQILAALTTFALIAGVVQFVASQLEHAPANAGRNAAT